MASRVATTRSASTERSTTMAGAFAGELIDDVEQLEGPVVDGGVDLEVQRQRGVRRDRAHRPHRGADPAVGLHLHFL